MKQVGLGFIQVFWGNGKGKTTAALGTALRACGNGYNVHLVQFMKNGVGDPEIDNPGEIRALETFDSFSVKRFGTDGWVVGKPTQNQIDAVKKAVDFVKSLFVGKTDIIIADEILYAVQLGLVSEDDILALIDAKPKDKELILTGSHKELPKVFDRADLITEIKKIKHPYDAGFLARKGLEY